jgi:hypothetical protein
LPQAKCTLKPTTGGVDDVVKLKPRLSTYNTGRIKEDLFYYSDVFLVSNYHVIEAQLKNLLGRFKNKKEKEMYRLHYNDMRYIVEYCVPETVKMWRKSTLNWSPLSQI